MLAVGVMLISPAFVSAMSFDISSFSLSELKELSSRITKRIAEIEKENKACFVSNYVLSLGDGEGDDRTQEVKRLQEFLREKGYLSAKSTGYFGKLTRAGLIAYQAGSGLSQTGEFDEATKVKAHSGTCKNYLLSGKALLIEKEKKELEYKKQNTDYGVKSTVTSIIVSADGKNVIWSSVGESKNGYKLVWSKTSNPTYPPRNTDRAQYHEGSKNKAEWLDAFDGAGNYYARVCEYLGSGCGVYSNEVVVTLEK